MVIICWREDLRACGVELASMTQLSQKDRTRNALELIAAVRARHPGKKDYLGADLISMALPIENKTIGMTPTAKRKSLNGR